MTTTCTDWPVDWPCDTCNGDPALYTRGRQIAQQLLWAATGRRFGVCESTALVRPRRTCRCAPSVDNTHPYLVNGEWHNYSCSDPCRDDCCVLYLPHTPVQTVVSVEVDGVALIPPAYFYDERSIRLTAGCWPVTWACEPARVEVTWTHGVAPPPGAGAAVGELACEFVAAWQNETCRLPSRMVGLTRQGVAMDFADPGVYLDSNLFGLPVVDAFVRGVNPNGLQRPSRVLSPDYGMRG